MFSRASRASLPALGLWRQGPPRRWSGLSHVDENGQAFIVDISAKAPTTRRATAKGRIVFLSAVATLLITADSNKKGDVVGTARLAGIMAVKRTLDLIPLCHPLPVTHVEVILRVDSRSVEAECTVKCDGKTGVEMEALTGVSVTLLTVYDMCKAVDRSMVIEAIRVVEKRGGKADYLEEA